jgi:PilZ domain
MARLGRTVERVGNTCNGSERRAAHRIDGRFPVQLRRRHGSSVLDCTSFAGNVSRSGLYTQLLTRVDVGRGVFSVVSLPTGSALVARGHVVRLEQLAGGGWGVAVRFTRARLLANDTIGFLG